VEVDPLILEIGTRWNAIVSFTTITFDPGGGEGKSRQYPVKVKLFLYRPRQAPRDPES
jgi:hypothetical protein